MKIYLASSWRNEQQPQVVKDLRQIGQEVYDFKNPKEGNNGFGWTQTDTHYKQWTPAKYIEILTTSPIAAQGFRLDFDAMQWADACVLLLPCGRSAHLEAGWMLGAGKPCFVYISAEKFEPELMYLIAGRSMIFSYLPHMYKAIEEFKLAEPKPTVPLSVV